jgi:hypothetical protein
MIKVAVLNADTELMTVLQDHLAQAGYATTRELVARLKSGQDNFLDFLAREEPEVILYDISPPYQANWNFGELLRNAQASEEVSFVLTTTNKPALERVVGPTSALQLTDDPLSVARLLAEVARVTVPPGGAFSVR